MGNFAARQLICEGSRAFRNFDLLFFHAGSNIYLDHLQRKLCNFTGIIFLNEFFRCLFVGVSYRSWQ